MSGTLSKVSLWERNPTTPEVALESVFEAYERFHPDEDEQLITSAFELANEAHTGQNRKSGEAYILHPIAVSEIVASLGLDDVTIASALLHDIVEDTASRVEDIQEAFGPEVALIVDSVTKLDRLKFDSKEAQQAATMRKMIVAVAKDVRVIIIKLADRLHNMRTLASLPTWKQERTAQETLDIYAPLAHRLGMQEVKNQLEDLSFAALYPKRYAEIDGMVATRNPERELYLTQAISDVSTRLMELGIDADVTGRPKHLWSIYEKMLLKGREFDEIYDLVGIRVVVDSVRDCYGALGCIHASWIPVQGRFKDYIAMPKFNLYQSLHTTVIGPQSKSLEVQIRTKEMHRRAEQGVAAHWEYKDDSWNDNMQWLNRIVDWQQETEDHTHFLSNLKMELEQDEVFVFTPAGEVMTLAAEATPVDFAYSVHTEVGHITRGARVNGRLVPLDTVLASGDTVEILTSNLEDAGPSQDWLKFVATHRAASKIKQWFSRERREDAIANGRDDVLMALRRKGLPARKIMKSDTMTAVAETLNYNDTESLLAGVGEGHATADSVASRVFNLLEEGGEKQEEVLPASLPGQRERERRKAGSRPGGGSGVVVEGVDDVLIRLAKCCTPVPPDEVMGFVTRGRGVSVHRSDCTNAVSLAAGQAGRLIDVEWDNDSDGVFVVAIEVKAFDRTRLLRDISNAMSDARINILAANTRTGGDRVSVMRFEFELGDGKHLEWLLSTIKQIDSVYDVYRVGPKQTNS